MAIFRFIPKKYKTMPSVKRLINYILREDKTTELLKGGIHCNPNTAYDEFILTKAMHNKLPEGLYSAHNEALHMAFSFAGKEASPEVAKKIVEEFLNDEKFQGFQIVYAVHTDTENAHANIVLNTVNHESGLRWHSSREDAKYLIKLANDISKGYGLTEVKLKEEAYKESNLSQKQNSTSQEEYHVRQEARSWKKETLLAGLAASKIAKGKEEYIGIMQSLGYAVRWEDGRKDITYMNQDGKKINSDKLGHPEKGYMPLTKASLEKQFDLNRQAVENGNMTVLEQQERVKSQVRELSLQIAKQKEKSQFQDTEPQPQEIKRWKAETLRIGLAAKRIARSREEYVELMNYAGYTVRWEDSRKDITYINRFGKKINSDKLGHPERNYTPLTKEALEKQFALNREAEGNESRLTPVSKSQLQNQILKLARELSHGTAEQYPFQNSDLLRTGGLEGQAIKDKLKELEKGKGLDWERD